jgi:TolB protein
LFALIDTSGLNAIDPNGVPHFPDWRVINAQALVTGRITRQLEGRLKTEFRLWDVAAGQNLAGVQYFTTQDTWRTIAHIISDQVCERLSGQNRHFEDEGRN